MSCRMETFLPVSIREVAFEQDTRTFIRPQSRPRSRVIFCFFSTFVRPLRKPNQKMQLDERNEAKQSHQ